MMEDKKVFDSSRRGTGISSKLVCAVFDDDSGLFLQTLKTEMKKQFRRFLYLFAIRFLHTRKRVEAFSSLSSMAVRAPQTSENTDKELLV